MGEYTAIDYYPFHPKDKAFGLLSEAHGCEGFEEFFSSQGLVNMVNAKDARIAELEAEVDQYENGYKSANDIIVEAEAQCNRWHMRCDALEAENAAFKARIAELDAEIDRLKQDVSEVSDWGHALADVLTAEIDRLKGELAARNDLLRGLRPLAEREMHYNTFTPEQQADAMDVLNRIDKAIGATDES